MEGKDRRDYLKEVRRVVRGWLENTMCVCVCVCMLRVQFSCCCFALPGLV